MHLKSIYMLDSFQIRSVVISNQNSVLSGVDRASLFTTTHHIYQFRI